MKLINKKTGKVIPIEIHNIAGKNYNSLAEINGDWEDYEEPKGKWFISNNGQIHNDEEHERYREERKQIGNYFETREEAEKALGRLKSLQELRNQGVLVDQYIDYIIVRSSMTSFVEQVLELNKEAQQTCEEDS